MGYRSQFYSIVELNEQTLPAILVTKYLQKRIILNEISVTQAVSKYLCEKL